MSKKVMEYVDSFSQDQKTKKIERVACYIRVSHQEQVLHGISLNAQRDKLNEYAEKHHLKIVEWYEDEGVSGRKLIKNRPELQRMLHDAQEGKFDRILFIKLDRFFRSVAEYHECMKYIDPVLWTATEEKYDLTTANGRAFVNMKLTIAELEADQTGERIKIVNDYKVKTGQALIGSQSQGVAYTVQTIDGIKRVVKDPNTKEMVEDFINYFLTHQNKQQAHQYVMQKYNSDVSYNAISRVLSDTKIYGFYRGNPEYCEPYVDKATFDKIQEVLKNNIKTPPTKKAYLFTGLIRCPKCGRKLTSICSTTRTNKKPNGKVYVYTSNRYYYRCYNHTANKSCDFNKRPWEKRIEDYLLANLETKITKYYKEVETLDNTPDLNKETVEKRIKETKTEMKNLTTAFRKSRITEAEYDKDYDELEAQLITLEAQLEPVKERDLAIYQELIKSGWKELYEALTRENKRAFWRKYIKEIVIDESGAVIDLIFF